MLATGPVSETAGREENPATPSHEGEVPLNRALSASTPPIRRRFERFDILRPGVVRDKQNGAETPGTITNVSRGGIFFAFNDSELSETPLIPGQSVEVSLMGGDDEIVSPAVLSARILRIDGANGAAIQLEEESVRHMQEWMATAGLISPDGFGMDSVDCNGASDVDLHQPPPFRTIPEGFTVFEGGKPHPRPLRLEYSHFTPQLKNFCLFRETLPVFPKELNPSSSVIEYNRILLEYIDRFTELITGSKDGILLHFDSVAILDRIAIASEKELGLLLKSIHGSDYIATLGHEFHEVISRIGNLTKRLSRIDVSTPQEHDPLRKVMEQNPQGHESLSQMKEKQSDLTNEMRRILILISLNDPELASDLVNVATEVFESRRFQGVTQVAAVVASSLHDIGKAAIIKLTKGGLYPPGSQEKATLQSHNLIGQYILKRTLKRVLPDHVALVAATAVSFHHQPLNQGETHLASEKHGTDLEELLDKLVPGNPELREEAKHEIIKMIATLQVLDIDDAGKHRNRNSFSKEGRNYVSDRLSMEKACILRTLRSHLSEEGSSIPVSIFPDMESEDTDNEMKTRLTLLVVEILNGNAPALSTARHLFHHPEWRPMREEILRIVGVIADISEILSRNEDTTISVTMRPRAGSTWIQTFSLENMNRFAEEYLRFVMTEPKSSAGEEKISLAGNG